MVEKVICIASDCENDILPTTAARTGGYCMPCVYKIAEMERRADIEANKRILDQYVGVTERLKILNLIVGTPSHVNPYIEYVPYKDSAIQVCSELSQDDADKFMRHCLKLMKDGDFDSAETEVGIVAGTVAFDKTILQKGVLKFDEITAPHLFFGASSQVVKSLTKLIKTHRDAPAALAWTRSSLAERELFAMRQVDQMIDYYALLAGWEFDEKGSRRELCQTICHSFEITDEVSSVGVACSDAEQKCPACGNDLIYLIDVGSSFVPVWSRSPRLRVLVCPRCSLFDPWFADPKTLEPAESTVPDNVRPLSENAPRSRLKLKTRTRSPLESLVFPRDSKLSQLGGFPSWLQDPEYPKCPSCLKTMLFIAQICMDDYVDELFYAFLCEDGCRTAVTRQHG